MRVQLIKSLSLASKRSSCRLVMQPWSTRQIRQRSAMFGVSGLLDIVSIVAVTRGSSGSGNKLDNAPQYVARVPAADSGGLPHFAINNLFRAVSSDCERSVNMTQNMMHDLLTTDSDDLSATIFNGTLSCLVPHFNLFDEFLVLNAAIEHVRHNRSHKARGTKIWRTQCAVHSA